MLTVIVVDLFACRGNHRSVWKPWCNPHPSQATIMMNMMNEGDYEDDHDDDDYHDNHHEDGDVCDHDDEEDDNGNTDDFQTQDEIEFPPHFDVKI